MVLKLGHLRLAAASECLCCELIGDGEEEGQTGTGGKQHSNPSECQQQRWGGGLA